MPEFRELNIDDIGDNPYGSCREHPEAEIDQLCGLIKVVGFLVPVVVDENNCRLNGDARIRAAKKLGMKTVPAIVVDGLSEAQKRAFILADNKIPENGRWDRKALGHAFLRLRELLVDANFDIDILGFSSVVMDEIVVELNDQDDPSDEIRPEWMAGECVTQPGDVFRLDQHRLGCGDARDKDFLPDVMDGRKADAGFFDVPYNMAVKDIGGRGRVKHPEFAMASGELSGPEYQTFLETCMEVAVRVSRNGAVHFYCMVWLYLAELILAGRKSYGKMLNMAVWAKPNAGLGGPWRSQHEEVCIFRVGDAKHRDNIQRGKFGRSRSNLWPYRGMNQFGPDRADNLKAHPTTKPILLIADALRDCTGRGDLVLDTFCGAGSTLLASERIGRTAVCVDIEPRYIDTTIRRWQDYTGKDAVHVASGLRFDELAGNLRRKA